MKHLVFANDGRYYLARETREEGGRFVPKPNATPRDSFGRSLDEPTIDDATLSQNSF